MKKNVLDKKNKKHILFSLATIGSVGILAGSTVAIATATTKFSSLNKEMGIDSNVLNFDHAAANAASPATTHNNVNRNVVHNNANWSNRNGGIDWSSNTIVEVKIWNEQLRINDLISDGIIVNKAIASTRDVVISNAGELATLFGINTTLDFAQFNYSYSNGALLHDGVLTLQIKVAAKTNITITNSLPPQNILVAVHGIDQALVNVEQERINHLKSSSNVEITSTNAKSAVNDGPILNSADLKTKLGIDASLNTNDFTYTYSRPAITAANSNVDFKITVISKYSPTVHGVGTNIAVHVVFATTVITQALVNAEQARINALASTGKVVNSANGLPTAREHEATIIELKGFGITTTLNGDFVYLLSHPGIISDGVLKISIKVRAKDNSSLVGTPHEIDVAVSGIGAKQVEIEQNRINDFISTGVETTSNGIAAAENKALNNEDILKTTFGIDNTLDTTKFIYTFSHVEMKQTGSMPVFIKVALKSNAAIVGIPRAIIVQVKVSDLDFPDGGGSGTKPNMTGYIVGGVFASVGLVALPIVIFKGGKALYTRFIKDTPPTDVPSAKGTASTEMNEGASTSGGKGVASTSGEATTSFNGEFFAGEKVDNVDGLNPSDQLSTIDEVDEIDEIAGDYHELNFGGNNVTVTADVHVDGTAQIPKEEPVYSNWKVNMSKPAELPTNFLDNLGIKTNPEALEALGDEAVNAAAAKTTEYYNRLVTQIGASANVGPEAAGNIANNFLLKVSDALEKVTTEGFQISEVEGFGALSADLQAELESTASFFNDLAALGAKSGEALDTALAEGAAEVIELFGELAEEAATPEIFNAVVGTFVSSLSENAGVGIVDSAAAIAETAVEFVDEFLIHIF